MKIYTLWQLADASDIENTVPWCIGAEDEYTVDNNNGHTEEYQKLRDNANGMIIRELVIEIPESAVVKLFRSPTVKAVVVDDTSEG